MSAVDDSTARPTLTSLCDTTVAGGSGTSLCTGGPTANLWRLRVRNGGVASLAGVDLRYATVTLDGGARLNVGSAALTSADVRGNAGSVSEITGSSATDSSFDFIGAPTISDSTKVRLTDSTLTRSSVAVQLVLSPVVRANNFVDGAGVGFGFATQSPFYAGSVTDRSQITDNTEPAHPRRRLLSPTST